MAYLEIFIYLTLTGKRLKYPVSSLLYGMLEKIYK